MHPFHHAATTPEKVAITVAGTGETVTYRQLEDRSNQGAQLFRSLGLKSGDAVALLMHNSARYLEITWAAQRAGLYYVCIPSRLTADEVSYMLIDSAAKMLIHSASLGDVAEKAAADAGTGVVRLAVGREAPAADDFEARRAAMPAERIADESPGQDMLYSSGTTGRPKGIRLPPLTGAIDDPTAVMTLARNLYDMNAATKYLSPAPMYHAAPLRYCMAVNQLGGTVVLMERFDAQESLELIERHRITHAQWVPTHFVRMLQLGAEVRGRCDLSSMLCSFHAAAPCPIHVKEQMLEWWGPIIHEYYSSTELNGFTAVTAAEWLQHPGTVGRAVFGVIKICDADGEPLPPRSEGLVHFAEGRTFEYHNDPEKTAKSKNKYGWTTVGDIGWVDEEGYLYLTDRQSFMIISGGVNIYPQEIENLLLGHPKVADAAVIGAPDPVLGEKVVAVVQPLAWADAGPALENELRAFLREHLSPVKAPKQIDFRPELPREPTGKLFKRLIRDEYRAETAATPEAPPLRTAGTLEPATPSQRP